MHHERRRSSIANLTKSGVRCGSSPKTHDDDEYNTGLRDRTAHSFIASSLNHLHISSLLLSLYISSSLFRAIVSHDGR